MGPAKRHRLSLENFSKVNFPEHGTFNGSNHIKDKENILSSDFYNSVLFLTLFLVVIIRKEILEFSRFKHF